MKKGRLTLAFVLLTILVMVLFFVNLCVGSASISWKESLSFLCTDSGAGAQILWTIRMPRALAAMLLGGALAVAGFLLQTFFMNPIAGPFVLGISSGAKLAVALVMIGMLYFGKTASSFTMIAAAFAGAMLSMGFVLMVSRRVQQMSFLVICGIMIGYICTAITDFIVVFADDSNIVNLHNWSLGSFSGISWENVKVITVIVLFSLFAAILLAKPMGAYQLGETYAQSMGVSIRAFRAALIVLSSILSATVAAFAGPVSFVGIAVPQLTRQLFHTAKPMIIIPGCFLAGASFCLFCDLLARKLFAPTEVSISSVTAVFGAPVVIAMMISRGKTR